MLDINSDLLLEKEDFNRIRKIVYDTTGITLADTKSALIVARLSKRLLKKGISGFGEYIALLNEDPSEILELVNKITTNLTYFYRESDQFSVLKLLILPELLKNKKNIIRIWSAACSTGAEVYTILFEMLDYFNGSIPDNIDLKILGSDIDTVVLSKAKRGAYTKEELNKLDKSKVKLYFDKLNEDQYIIKENLKKYVGFRKINLIYDKFSFKGKIDIIFCRNVAIYFNEETKDKLYNKFYNVLSEQSYVFSGQSENLFRWNNQYKFIKNSIYKKVL